MRRLLPCVLLVSFTPVLAAQELSDEERKDGFISLFNGKDFSGLRFFGYGKKKKDADKEVKAPLPKNWSVADGMIKLSGGGSPHLGTQWEFTDFDVRFQWRAHKKGYNSGFFVRTGRESSNNQINLAEKSCGNLMGYKGGPGVPDLQKPVGEWNDWRVLCEGKKIKFWVNGKEAWEVDTFKPARGYLGWQAEGAAIDFKNIRIKELGFVNMDDPKLWTDGAGWAVTDGTWTKSAKARAIITPKRYNNFTLRLEWRDGFKPFTQIEFGGGRPAKLHMSMEDIRKATNPAGEWNCLELTVKDKKGTVWLNGQTVMKEERLEKDTVPGPILLIPGEEATAFRHIRIQALPD
ncbi:MAG: family 16 glycoside hydrolase [Gemmataceae bacterium]